MEVVRWGAIFLYDSAYARASDGGTLKEYRRSFLKPSSVDFGCGHQLNKLLVKGVRHTAAVDDWYNVKFL